MCPELFFDGKTVTVRQTKYCVERALNGTAMPSAVTNCKIMLVFYTVMMNDLLCLGALCISNT